MVHDFIVTENHLLFPILPITGSMERAMGGRPPYAWEPDKGAYVGVMKRNGGGTDIVWFRAEVQLGHRVPDGFHGNWVGAA